MNIAGAFTGTIGNKQYWGVYLDKSQIFSRHASFRPCWILPRGTRLFTDKEIKDNFGHKYMIRVRTFELLHRTNWSTVKINRWKNYERT